MEQGFPEIHVVDRCFPVLRTIFCLIVGFKVKAHKIRHVGEIMRTHLLLFRLVIHPFVENAARQDEIVDLSPQEKLRPEGIGFRVILVI